MACALKVNFSVSGSNETLLNSRTKGNIGFFPPTSMAERRSKDFMSEPLHVLDQSLSKWKVKASTYSSVHAQTSFCVSRAMRWWEKTLVPNMTEIHSAQELIDSLLNAGDKLVIVDFYSPGCGGCKALHPKICQLAESNPNAIILKVNYEELKTMCYTLHIHVLPFFRFYRGAEGKLCSFSCTNTTIKKFKDALAKYGSDRCSLGPAKGLDESELLGLASIGQISINSSDLVPKGITDVSGNLGKANSKMVLKEEKAMLMA
ncbi:unnamed protein product [Ilex paraguariensis]|uniref:Thioredoxin domain-containing protein n=1 Tax=Ilex paraguariensis TaxID=185542 RepID=A0ABC8R0B1_9AQUA